MQLLPGLQFAGFPAHPIHCLCSPCLCHAASLRLCRPSPHFSFVHPLLSALVYVLCTACRGRISQLRPSTSAVSLALHLSTSEAACGSCTCTLKCTWLLCLYVVALYTMNLEHRGISWRRLHCVFPQSCACYVCEYFYARFRIHASRRASTSVLCTLLGKFLGSLVRGCLAATVSAATFQIRIHIPVRRQYTL